MKSKLATKQVVEPQSANLKGHRKFIDLTDPHLTQPTKLQLSDRKHTLKDLLHEDKSRPQEKQTKRKHERSTSVTIRQGRLAPPKEKSK
jgi:hypothetical protein